MTSSGSNTFLPLYHRLDRPSSGRSCPTAPVQTNMSAFITRLPFRRQGSSDVSDTASDVKPPSLRSDDEKLAPATEAPILHRTDKTVGETAVHHVDAPEAKVSQLEAHNLLANGKEVRTCARASEIAIGLRCRRSGACPLILLASADSHAFEHFMKTSGGCESDDEQS